jgi:hypothetical protein
MKRGEIAQQVTRGAFFLAIEKTAALLSGMVYFALMLRWLGPTNYGMLTLALAITGSRASRPATSRCSSSDSRPSTRPATASTCCSAHMRWP